MPGPSLAPKRLHDSGYQGTKDVDANQLGGLTANDTRPQKRPRVAAPPSSPSGLNALSQSTIPQTTETQVAASSARAVGSTHSLYDNPIGTSLTHDELPNTENVSTGSSGSETVVCDDGTGLDLEDFVEDSFLLSLEDSFLETEELDMSELTSTEVREHDQQDAQTSFDNLPAHKEAEPMRSDCLGGSSDFGSPNMSACPLVSTTSFTTDFPSDAAVAEDPRMKSSEHATADFQLDWKPCSISQTGTIHASDTFFHIDEIVQVDATPNARNSNPVFGLFARVIYSSRENFFCKQYFQMRDLFGTNGPYITGALMG